MISRADMQRRVFLKTVSFTAAGLALGGMAVHGKTITHKVVRGDTLSELAQIYHTSVQSIKNVNNLRSDTIVIGKRLLIPLASKYLYINDIATKSAKLSIPSSRWRYIVVHHSGIKYGNAKSYDSYHRDRGMKNGLAYHFIIGNGLNSGNGTIEIGNRWLKQLDGGHVKNNFVNQTGIGICLVGNFQKEHPSQRQLGALYELIDYLRNERLKGKIKVAVHKEIDGSRHTVCPGRNFPISALHKKYPS